jgi:hypothetical protein
MHYAEGGSLRALIGDSGRLAQLTPARKLEMLSQVAESMAGLYAMVPPITHRDLKSE